MAATMDDANALNTPAPDSRHEEHRRVSRTGCHINALLRIEGDYLCMATVTDISSDGMRLHVHHDGVLPTEFEVDGVSAEGPVRVRRMWRRRQEVGVRLIKTAVAGQ